MRGGPLSEILNCIRCGACLNACPVFREIGGHAYLSASGCHTPYPGPVGSVVSPALFGLEEFGNLAHASSLCGACQEACPVDIDLPGLLLRVRAGEKNNHDTKHISPGLRWGLQVFSWAATSPRLFGLAQRMVGLFSALISPRMAWLHMPAFSGWGLGRDFPRPAQRPFRARFQPAIPIKVSESLKAPVRIAQPQNHPQQTVSSTVQQQANTTHSIQAASGQTLIEQFSAELSALGALFIRCTTNQVSKQVLQFLQERQIGAIQSWEAEFLPEGLIGALCSQGIRVEHQPHPDLRAGLTGALAGIAETGSLVLAGGPGHPLSASLLPEVHIAILHADQIIAHLVDGLKLPALQSASSSLVISGPSRTADIEMTLTVGMHGPGEVHVFCLTDC